MKQITKTLAVVFVALATIACTGNKQKQSPQTPDAHSPRMALSWQGTYEGITPCADCPGIYVLLALDDEGSYEMYEKYLERDAVFLSKGKFEWNATEDSIQLLSDGKMIYAVGENELSNGNFTFSRISDEQELSDSYTETVIKDDESGENVSVELSFQNGASIAKFLFGGKEYTLTENRDNGQEQLFTDGKASLVWNIIDPAPVANYKPTLTIDGKTYTFTRLTPTNYLYVTTDANAAVKGFDVTYFNVEDDKSFVKLLSSDIQNCYTLPQSEASAKTAVYEKDGVQWLTGNKKATLIINGKETVYNEEAMSN